MSLNEELIVHVRVGKSFQKMYVSRDTKFGLRDGCSEAGKNKMTIRNGPWAGLFHQVNTEIAERGRGYCQYWSPRRVQLSSKKKVEKCGA